MVFFDEEPTVKLVEFEAKLKLPALLLRPLPPLLSR